jgi:hypothetical protein
MQPRSAKNGWKKERKFERLETIKNKYYIFCEGEKTEPHYFEGFKRYIEHNSIYKNLVLINVEGVGKETERVLDDAIEYVQRNKIKDAQIWCVYDKDSFPPKRFNNVSIRVNELNKNKNNINYRVAWSNQCIEYWFILHFCYYDSDNDRGFYKDNLNESFKKNGLDMYNKSKDNEIFEKLTFKGDPKLAIRYAKKRIKECCGKTCSDSAPATKVYELAEELAKYLPEDVKSRYI